jgi:teichuronic acid exporter
MNKKFGIRGAALFQFGSKYISMGAQLVITAVLARLIDPDDFGLVAIVTVFTGLFSLLSDMGVSTAIVQYRNLTEEDYGGIFGFSILLALGLTVVFCTLSPLIALFYSDNRLIPLCLAAAPTLLFSTLNMVPEGLMLKGKRFDRIALRLVVATAVSGTIAIIAAFLGAGAVALVMQTVISSAIVLVWNLITRPIHRVSMHFMKPLKKIFSYSAYQFGFSLINYFSRNLDNMLVGRFFGSTQLGYYDKAYKLTSYPMSAFSSVIASVIQPFMAEHEDNPNIIFDCFMKVEKLLSLVGICIAAVFFCASSEIVYVLYGPSWEPSIPVFAVLSISVYFQMMGNPSGAFFQSLGHTDYMFKVGLINTSITCAGLFLGLAGGSILTVADGIGVAFCLHVITIIYFLIWKGFGKSLQCLKVFIPEILIGFSASIICNLIFSIVTLPTISSLFCKCFIVIGVLIFGYWRTGQFIYFKKFINK